VKSTTTFDHPLLRIVRTHSLALVLLVLLAFAGWLACANPAAELRKHTYPPDFRYIESQEIEGAMWTLAALAERLHDISSEPADADAHRIEIVGILSNMEALTNSLKRDGIPSNHPRLNRNLDKFRADIQAASRAVEHDPPNYLRAAAIPGACVYCHGD
jgi:hypothetical protein